MNVKQAHTWAKKMEATHLRIKAHASPSQNGKWYVHVEMDTSIAGARVMIFKNLHNDSEATQLELDLKALRELDQEARIPAEMEGPPW